MYFISFITQTEVEKIFLSGESANPSPSASYCWALSLYAFFKKKMTFLFKYSILKKIHKDK